MMATGENCSSPFVIGANDTASGTTTDGGHDFLFSSSAGCTGSSSTSTAPDVVYQVAVPTFSRVTATFTTTWDSIANIITSVPNCGALDGGVFRGQVCASGRDTPDNAPVRYVNTSGTTQNVFLVLDGWGSGNGAYSLSTATGPVGAGDVCENAVPLTAGMPLMGEALNAADIGPDYSGSGSGCASSAAGNDKVYSISIPSGQRLVVSVTPTGFDSSLSLVDGASACATRTCVANANASGTGTADTLTFFNSGPTRTFFLIVDSTSSTTSGTFDISAALQTPVAGDVCTSPTDLTALPMNTARGQSTTGLGADYSGSGNGAVCSTASAGPDAVYSLVVPAGARGVFTVTPDAGFDPSLSIAVSVADCNSRTCAVGTNAAGASAAETASASNRTTAPTTLFAYVDSTSTAGGQFDIVGIAEPSPLGDYCGNAPVLVPGMPQTGTIANYTNDYVLTGTNCSSAVAGQDRAYQVDVPANSRLSITLVADGGYNPVLNLVDGPFSNCDSTTRVCVANDNTGGTNGTDVVSIANPGAATRPLFAIIDSTSAAPATASFQITAAVTMIAANDLCESAGAPITASASLMGDLSTAQPDYNWSGQAGCTSSGTTGRDLAYTIVIPGGQQLSAVVQSTSGTWDPSLQLVDGTSCGGSTQTCVGGRNALVSTAAGSGEALQFTNPGTTSRTVSLIVDTSTTTPGQFALQIVLGPIVNYAAAPIMSACDDMTGATALSGVTGDDVTSAVTALPSGFAFSYFGVPATHFSASSNGFVQIHHLAPSLTSSTAFNASIPDSATPNGLIAALWDDLNVGTGASGTYNTFGMAPNRRFTFQWANYTFFGGESEQLTIQVQLHETTNLVEVHYCSLVPAMTMSSAARTSGGSATVGVESLDGSRGTQVSTNSVNPGIATGGGYRFTP
ncbi:MAG: hypothetical protein JNJ54_10520 [Myxococcaceae bacterium]|nr:hypothetical protein [Myxococcaceae bacterium]